MPDGWQNIPEREQSGYSESEYDNESAEATQRQSEKEQLKDQADQDLDDDRLY